MPQNDAQTQLPKTTVTIPDLLRRNWLNWLLIFIPVSIVVEIMHLPELWLFVTSALAIIPLAGLIGQATEEVAERVGPTMGGFLNATFGNATELIIALLALRAGLHEVVKASISGSIIGNILLVLGLSMFAGGLGREKQRFSRTHTGASTTMLFLGVVALVMPAVFDLNVYGTLHPATAPAPIPQLSLLVSVVLMLIYLASLVFSLRTHKPLFQAEDHGGRAHLPVPLAIGVLLGATVLTAIEAEFLVSSIGTATRVLGMTEFFVGVVVVAVIGNAAEHFSAVVMARRNKMDLAVSICTGSSTQIALFVAPVLVFASFLFGQPMSLVFNAFEIVGIALSVLALAVVSLDGESNWFEGLQLTAVYVVLAIVFYFVPGK
ncbi:MAG: calcium/proton exchanger [Armatimonadota bacterium]